VAQWTFVSRERPFDGQGTALLFLRPSDIEACMLDDLIPSARTYIWFARSISSTMWAVGCGDEADDRGGCSCRALGAAATQGHQLGEAEHGGLGPGGWEGKPSPPVVRRAGRGLP